VGAFVDEPGEQLFVVLVEVSYEAGQQAGAVVVGRRGDDASGSRSARPDVRPVAPPSSTTLFVVLLLL